MPMKVEAAIVTQKRPSAEYNTDSVNINGKVFSRDVIKNGYKGSGVISGNVYFALTSSGVDGFADAAVAAFNERAEMFGVSRDVRNVFSGFYEDCRAALLKIDREPEELVCSCLYAGGRKAVLAHNCNAALFFVRAGKCSLIETIKVSDTVADYSSSIYPDVAAEDIFILASPGISEVLAQKDIEDICKVSDGSVKRIVNLISKVALARQGDKAVSIIAVKILETDAKEEQLEGGFVADFSDVAATQTSEDSVTEKNEAAEEKIIVEIEDNAPVQEEVAVVTEEAAEETEETDGAEENAVDAEEPIAEENTAETTEEAASEEKTENNEENTSVDDVQENASDEEVNESTDGEQVEVNENGENKSDEIVSSFEKSFAEKFNEMLIVEENGADSEENTENEEISAEASADEINGKKASKSRAKLIVATVFLFIFAALLLVVIFFLKSIDSAEIPVNETTTLSAEETTLAEETTDEVAADDETTEEGETASEETTKAEEKTTKAEEKTTKAEEKTTKAEEKTTKPDEEPSTFVVG